MMAQPDSPPISVVVPAYNEEHGVGPQIAAIRRVLCEHGIPHEIVVVDDGSHDRTAEAARRAGARVLQHPDNRCYGAALKTGIRAALYDTIVISDADGTYPPEAIPALVAQLATADMVVGARTGPHVHIPWMRRLAKWVLNWLARRIAGQPIPDLNSGLRAFRRACVQQYFALLSSRFAFTTTSSGVAHTATPLQWRLAGCLGVLMGLPSVYCAIASAHLVWCITLSSCGKQPRA